MKIKSKSWKTDLKISRLSDSPQIGDLWILSPHRPDGKESEIKVEYIVTDVWFDGTIVHKAEHGARIIDHPDGSFSVE